MAVAALRPNQIDFQPLLPAETIFKQLRRPAQIVVDNIEVAVVVHIRDDHAAPTACAAQLPFWCERKASVTAVTEDSIGLYPLIAGQVGEACCVDETIHHIEVK